jgi:hypothetical protein
MKTNSVQISNLSNSSTQRDAYKDSLLRKSYPEHLYFFNSYIYNIRVIFRLFVYTKLVVSPFFTREYEAY